MLDTFQDLMHRLQMRMVFPMVSSYPNKAAISSDGTARAVKMTAKAAHRLEGLPSNSFIVGPSSQISSIQPVR